MVNRVVQPTEMVSIVDEIEYFRQHGYYLHVSPVDFNIAEYSSEAREVLFNVRSEMDVKLPILEQTSGKLCEYPQFGLQLLPSGYARIPPCDEKTVEVIRNPANIHKLLKTDLFACPGKCVCFHQYPWVAGGYSDIDIMKEFVERNKQWRATHPLGSGVGDAVKSMAR